MAKVKISNEQRLVVKNKKTGEVDCFWEHFNLGDSGKQVEIPDQELDFIKRAYDKFVHARELLKKYYHQ